MNLVFQIARKELTKKIKSTYNIGRKFTNIGNAQQLLT